MTDDIDTSDARRVPHDADAALTPARVQVPPWMQLVGFPLVVFFGYLFVQAASHAVVVFLVATLISLLLAPVVRRLVLLGLPRLVSVLAVFGLFALVVTILSIVAVDVVAAQAVEVRDSASDIGSAAVTKIDELQDFADRHGWNIDVRDQAVRFVDRLEERSTELSGDALQYGREFVTIVAEAAFNLVLIVVITIYMLLDAPRISRRLAAAMPTGSNSHVLFRRMERSLFRYVVGQTLASLVMGVSATAGLWLMGVTGIWDNGEHYAVLVGLIVAVTEFAPSIGPVIGAVPPVMLALFDGFGPMLAVLLFFVLLHQIEGHIVIPKLMGTAIAVHPLLVIFGILAGAQVMGIGGILLALPLLAVGREIVLFVRERVSLGRWPDGPPTAVFGSFAAGADALAEARTGAAVATGAAAAHPTARVLVVDGTLRARARQAWGALRRRTRRDESPVPEASATDATPSPPEGPTS